MTYKAALVTGAGARLGRAMALKLAEKGVSVAVHYAASEKGAAETADMVREKGVSAAVVQADLLDRDAILRLVPRAVDALEQPLDVLINNASIFEYDNIETASFESWDRHMATNLKAPLFLTQVFAAQAPDPLLDEGGEPVARASVVNMIDQRVRKLTPEFMTYTLAKSALWTLTQTSAQALAPKVRVNGIGPGPTIQGHRQSESHFAKQRAATILKRGSSPFEIAQALDFILGTAGLTGQILCLDGGQHLSWQTPDVLGVE